MTTRGKQKRKSRPAARPERSRSVQSRSARATSRAGRTTGPRLVIVGFGRIGGAMALGLKAQGYDVATLPRSQESVRKAARLGVRLADHDDLRRADICVLAVPDANVSGAAEAVAEDLGPETALVHCSGALTLEALLPGAKNGKRPLGSLHPLVAVSDTQDSLAGGTAALAASDQALLANLEGMAKALGLSTIQVPETGRVAYHAGAVMSAGLLVSLADAAVAALEHAGVERDEAVKALVPLMESALRGVKARGVEKGLTGPVVRGDVAVVQAHLEALPPELGAIYRLLSRRALKLVQTLPVETRAALERTLA